MSATQWREKEQKAIHAINALIDGGLESTGDRRAISGWFERDAKGHVTTVNLEGGNAFQVTDDWLIHFAAFAELDCANLDYNPALTGSGFRHWKNLHRLTVINVMATEVDDLALEHIRNHTQLEWLRLQDTKVTDRGIAQLRSMRRLRGLELFRTLEQITDASVPIIQGFVNLEFLDLTGTNVSEPGIMTLLQSLPKCEIRHSTGAHR